MQAVCREKPLLFYMCPYRKPTQVDEERILRPTEEDNQDVGSEAALHLKSAYKLTGREVLRRKCPGLKHDTEAQECT